MMQKIFKGYLRFGFPQARFYISFDQNHLYNLQKAQQNLQNSQNMNELIHYQLQLSNAYGIFPQQNQKICSHSLFHKYVAVKLGLENKIQIDKNLIDLVTQDNVHFKLVYQNYYNQAEPSGYDQYYNDSLFLELLRLKYILFQSKQIDRNITKEEFKEWKQTVQRVENYQRQHKEFTKEIQVQCYFLQIEYFTCILFFAQLSGEYQESLDELIKSLDTVDKAKQLVKQEDPNYKILLQYQARAAAHLSSQLVSKDLPQCLKLIEQSLNIYEELDQQYDQEYINMYFFFCSYYRGRYDLISRTQKIYQQLKTLDNHYKDQGYQTIAIILFNQQIVIHQFEMVNEIKTIIEKHRDVLNREDFRIVYLINIYTAGFGKDVDAIFKNVPQISQFLNVVALFLSRNEYQIMSEQIKNANQDSLELNSMILLLKCLFSDTNQYYPFITNDRRIWEYLTSLFKLCFQDLFKINDNIPQITKDIVLIYIQIDIILCQ